MIANYPNNNTNKYHLFLLGSDLVNDTKFLETIQKLNINVALLDAGALTELSILNNSTTPLLGNTHNHSFGNKNGLKSLHKNNVVESHNSLLQSSPDRKQGRNNTKPNNLNGIICDESTTQSRLHSTSGPIYSAFDMIVHHKASPFYIPNGKPVNATLCSPITNGSFFPSSQLDDLNGNTNTDPHNETLSIDKDTSNKLLSMTKYNVDSNKPKMISSSPVNKTNNTDNINCVNLNTSSQKAIRRLSQSKFSSGLMAFLSHSSPSSNVTNINKNCNTTLDYSICGNNQQQNQISPLTLNANSTLMDVSDEYVHHQPLHKFIADDSLLMTPHLNGKLDPNSTFSSTNLRHASSHTSLFSNFFNNSSTQKGGKKAFEENTTITVNAMSTEMKLINSTNNNNSFNTFFDSIHPFYLVSDFTGSFWDKLQREKFGRRLIGPPFLYQLQRHPYLIQHDFLEMRHPIFCLSMRGLNLCFSRFTDTLKLTNLVCLAQYMGATVRKKFNGSKVTHLISLTVQGDKYRAASNLGKPIMSHAWIEYCWEQRFHHEFKPTDEEIINRFKLKPFVGCSISFIGFPAEEKNHMEELAKNNGAIVVDCENSAVTHLVVDELNVKPENLTNLSESRLNSLLIVKAEWFWVSIQLDFCADEKLYSFLRPSSQYSSTDGLLATNEYGYGNHIPAFNLTNFSHSQQQSSLGGSTLCNTPATPLSSANSTSSLLNSAAAVLLSNNHHGRNTDYQNLNSSMAASKQLSGSRERSQSASHILDDTRAYTTNNLFGQTNINGINIDLSGPQSLLNQISYGKCQSARHMIALEILNTERNYVNCLDLIRKVYHKPLEEVKNAPVPQISINDENTAQLFEYPNIPSNNHLTIQQENSKVKNVASGANFNTGSMQSLNLIAATNYLSPKTNNISPSFSNNTLLTANTTIATSSGCDITVYNGGAACTLNNNMMNNNNLSHTLTNSVSSVNSASNLLDTTEVKAIFGNLPPIHEVHKRMLIDLTNALQTYSEEQTQIGHIILSHVDGMLKAYPPFINFFHDSKNTLKRCDQTKPKFHAFLKICQNKPECGRQSLEDLMIRPVQRLPSLILLLSDLLKHTPEDSSDKFALNESINAVKNVLDHINEGKRKTETQLHMFEIVNDIENCPPNLLSSQRTFLFRANVQNLAHDSATTANNLKGKHMTLFLFNDCLEICKRKNPPTTLNKLATLPFFNSNNNSTTTHTSLNNHHHSDVETTTSHNVSKLSNSNSIDIYPNHKPANTDNNSLTHKNKVTLKSQQPKNSSCDNADNSLSLLVKRSSTQSTIYSAGMLNSLPSVNIMAGGGGPSLTGKDSFSSKSSNKNYKHVELLHLSHIKVIGDIVDNGEFVNSFAIICSNNHHHLFQSNGTLKNPYNNNHNNINGCGTLTPNFNPISNHLLSNSLNTEPNNNTNGNEGRLLLFSLQPEEDNGSMSKAFILEALHKNTVNTLCLSDGRSILQPIHPDQIMISSPMSNPVNSGTLSKAFRTAKKLLSRKMSRAFSFNKSTPFKLKRTVSTLSSFGTLALNQAKAQHEQTLLSGMMTATSPLITGLHNQNDHLLSNNNMNPYSDDLFNAYPFTDNVFESTTTTGLFGTCSSSSLMNIMEKQPMPFDKNYKNDALPNKYNNNTNNNNYQNNKPYTHQSSMLSTTLNVREQNKNAFTDLKNLDFTSPDELNQQINCCKNDNGNDIVVHNVSYTQSNFLVPLKPFLYTSSPIKTSKNEEQFIDNNHENILASSSNQNKDMDENQNVDTIQNNPVDNNNIPFHIGTDTYQQTHNENFPKGNELSLRSQNNINHQNGIIQSQSLHLINNAYAYKITCKENISTNHNEHNMVSLSQYQHKPYQDNSKHDGSYMINANNINNVEESSNKVYCNGDIASLKSNNLNENLLKISKISNMSPLSQRDMNKMVDKSSGFPVKNLGLGSIDTGSICENMKQQPLSQYTTNTKFVMDEYRNEINSKGSCESLILTHKL